MNKKRTLIILILAVSLLIAGCYTKRKGIVPCPGSYYEINNEIPSDITVRHA
jgi:nitrous oxide reductase accessory protein NosL